MNKCIVGLMTVLILGFSTLGFASTSTKDGATCRAGAKHVIIKLKTKDGNTVDAKVKCSDIHKLKKGSTVELP